MLVAADNAMPLWLPHCGEARSCKNKSAKVYAGGYIFIIRMYIAGVVAYSLFCGINLAAVRRRRSVWLYAPADYQQGNSSRIMAYKHADGDSGYEYLCPYNAGIIGWCGNLLR